MDNNTQCDNSVLAQCCCDDLNPVRSCWFTARQLSERPQLMVLGNYMVGGRRREEGALHDVGMFGAVFAAAGRSVDASRSGCILVI